MKRTITILLGLMLVLPVTACGQKKTQQTESIDITYHDILEANRSSELLKNHDSVSFTVLGEDGVSTISEVYIDEDLFTSDYSEYQIIYTTEVQGTLQDGVFSPILDLSEGTSYEYNRDYFLLSPSDSEKVTDCVKKGQTLLVTTALSPEDSAPLIESQLGEAQEGDYLSNEYCVDADSYQLQSYGMYLCREGEEPKQLQSIEKISYDAKTPAYIAGALEIAAAPKHQATPENLRTVAVVMDPNTTAEKTISTTVPKGSGVSIAYREGYGTLYLDRACTEIYTEGTADKNEDLMLYCPPDKTVDPDQQAAATFTAQQAMETNTVKSMLKSYQTITYAQLDYSGANTMHIMYFVNEAGDVCSVEDDNGYAAYQTDALVLARENGKSSYHIQGEQKGFVSEQMLMVAGSEFTSQTTDGDGNIVCETEADIDKEYAGALSDSGWAATTKDKMLTTAVFDGSDHRVLSIDYTILQPDGTEKKIASGVILYDAEREYPEGVQDYLDAEKLAVTVTLADGSTRTAWLPKGECFTWSCDKGYALYADKDGKNAIPETSAPVKSDLHVYVLKK